MDNLEYVYFYDKSSVVKEKRKGVIVGEHLAITYARGTTSRYRIYGLLSGRPVTLVSFPATNTGIEQAVEFAKWLDKIYGEYWDLWQAYPEWDVIQMCQYSVPEGVKVKEVLNKLEKREVITLDEFRNTWYSHK